MINTVLTEGGIRLLNDIYYNLRLTNRHSKIYIPIHILIYTDIHMGIHTDTLREE